MTTINALAVYCGSSNHADHEYYNQARNLGKIIAKEGVKVVFGGGRVGLMGAVANGALEAKGKVVGYISEYLQEVEIGHGGITELHVVPDMHTRKRLMYEQSDGFVILPGGFGTLDEVFEILTWRQLKMHTKPIVFVNILNYWKNLELFLKHMVNEKILKEEHFSFFHMVPSVDDIFPLLKDLSQKKHHSEYSSLEENFSAV